MFTNFFFSSSTEVCDYDYRVNCNLGIVEDEDDVRVGKRQLDEAAQPHRSITHRECRNPTWYTADRHPANHLPGTAFTDGFGFNRISWEKVVQD